MKNNYSIAERNRIVEENLPMIDKAIRHNRALMKAARLDCDDVHQDLALQLVLCVEHYDPDGGSLHAQIAAQLQGEFAKYSIPHNMKGVVPCLQMC